MSIIGPRPGDVESKDTYRQDEKDKLLIRPGITGFTQAYYRNNIGVREKRLYDAYIFFRCKSERPLLLCAVGSASKIEREADRGKFLSESI